MRCIPTVRAQLHAVIERALMLLNELDGAPDPADGCRAGDGRVEPGDDRDREDEDDNGVADQGGLAWVEGRTLPTSPKRLPMRRVRNFRRV